MLTLNALISVGIGPTQARQFLEPLNRLLPKYGIDAPSRVAGFIGQVFVESMGFTALEEGLYYTRVDRLRRVFPSRIKDDLTASRFVRNPKGLANFVYANRLGNGDEASGDGWRRRGRGLKQITGHDNYLEASEKTGNDYMGNPDLVSTPEHAVLTACTFWQARRCSALADAQDWDAVTRTVNGPAMLQKTERAAKARQVLKALAAA